MKRLMLVLVFGLIGCDFHVDNHAFIITMRDGKTFNISANHCTMHSNKELGATVTCFTESSSGSWESFEAPYKLVKKIEELK